MWFTSLVLAGWVSTSPLPGDVNGDSSVNALDVVAVINHFLGFQLWPQADVTGDGTVNALDVVFVINQALDLGRWRPAVGASLQIQFSGLPINPAVAADVYDIDLFDHDAAAVATLHAQGRKVLCYLNAGAWEDWRPDRDQFPPAVLGNDYAGWPGERWLDIRRIDLLAPILRARLDQCQAKGFDGVDPDNVNGYQNDTGFPLTAQDQLAYNRWLAGEAHVRGLAIGLKNDTEQASELAPYFDFAVTESCLAEDWCDQTLAFIDAGKAVFAIEYTDATTIARFLNEHCPRAAAWRLSAVLKNRLLDTWRLDCP